MSRTTQYIGLNKSGRGYVQPLTEINQEDNFCLGMFYEPVPLGVWYFKGMLVKEVEQETPWSSGPMIFTCLEDSDGNRYCEWTRKEMPREFYENPHPEYDDEKGEIYI